MDDRTHEFLAMRSEWLKVRGYLYDPNTSLPAVPAVLEDVRRRIERGEPVGVIYLDLSGEEYLEEVYGWETYDGLLQQVAHALDDFRGPLLADGDLVALAGVRSDQFLLFVGLKGRRGARELAQLRDKVVAELGKRIKIQVGKEVPRGLGIYSASSILKYDPTVRIERSIYKVLDGIRLECHRDRQERLSARRRELRRILQSRDILIRYQPIVRLDDGSVYGYEALSCGPEGDLFQNPEMLFSFAEKTDQILDLERLCRLESVRGSVRLPRGHKLFLNCSAHGIADAEGLSEHLVAQVVSAGLAPSDVVLEITERVAVTAWHDFRRRIDDLRALGFGVAIDDMGAGYSSLHSVAEVEPDFLKFDIALVRDIHLSPIKRGLLESLVLLAERIEAEVIAEGVEKDEEFQTLREMKVPFGQGYLFSPPMTMAFHVPEEP
ncbi:MAG TPA: EAL domain-containing protein [Thermoanaerobaculia bacterium]|jgi:EAL domain-containing protein (putative c-di-GMP-specific phosphodiesterase class I)/GGDEF domain-containing protein|nr:EAL domain-containing protein [Thermoanaerobaculia bacterium]